MGDTDDTKVENDTNNTDLDNNSTKPKEEHGATKKMSDEQMSPDINLKVDADNNDKTSECEVVVKEESSTENPCNGCATDNTNQKYETEPGNVKSGSTSDEHILRAGNSSLCNLLVYGSDSSSSDSDSSSDSESCESVGISDNEEVCAAKIVEDPKKKTVAESVARTFGELSIDDLPPVPDLSKLDLNITENDCVHMGNVTGIIDRLVTIDSLPNVPAYDLETLLFIESGKKPLGYVDDVMGPVTSPTYVVRFNSREDIDNMGVRKGLAVYSAPRTKHTQFVFLDKLLHTKGSDASWTGDNEVPVEFAEFSDDEEEREYRRNLKGDSRKRNSLDRHQVFEKDMNVKNIINSRLHKIRDSFEPSSKRHAPNSTATSNNNDKKGFPFQPGPIGRPVFAVNPTVPSFNPFVSGPFVQMPQYPMPFMAPVMQMPPMNVPPPFMPNIPPPPIPIAMPRPPVEMGGHKHPQGVPPPRMMFPPDMGLPRPRGTFVPYFNPGMANIWGYQNVRPTQPPRPRGFYPPKNTWT